MFNYCPNCGEKIQPHANPFQQHCESCHSDFFQNQNSTVCGVIIFEDKLLLAKRGRDPLKGLWDVPGGFVDPTEHPEAAVIREMKEEFGLDMKVDKLLTILAPQPYEFQGKTQYNCDHLYLLEVETLEGISAQDDVADFKLFTKDDLPPLEQCAFECTAWVVREFGSGRI